MFRLAATAALTVVVLTGCTTDPADTTAPVATPLPSTASPVATTASTTSIATTATAVESTPTTHPPTTSTAASTTIPEPPRLTITDPSHGQTITTETYVFRGMTDPGNSVAVGGKYMATVQVDGTWTLSLQLGPGRNSTTFAATDPDSGLETEAAIRVYYVERPGYAGTTLRTVWHEGNWQQEYYLDQQSTGYFSGSRLPLRWSADGNVDRSVAMASRDESIPLQAFNAPFDGLVMLLEPAGRDEYLVLDEQPVMIAKGAAVLTAACPANDIPSIVTLSLTQDGLDPTQAWAIDLDAGTLTQVDVEGLDCPSFEARPVGVDGIGAITSQLRCGYGIDCSYRIYDISTGQVKPMEYWSYGGSVLADHFYYSGHAFGHVSQTPFDAANPGGTRIWLEEMIAVDWTGRSIWRVLDATPELDLYAHYDCRVTSADDHLPAVAEVDHTDDRRLVQAWAVSTDGDHFVEVDPNSVQCQEEEGD